MEKLCLVEIFHRYFEWNKLKQDKAHYAERSQKRNNIYLFK